MSIILALLSNLKKPNTQRWLFLGALILVIFFWMKSCSDTREEIAIANHNLAALSDTITAINIKNGQLEFQKTAYIADNDRLKTLNKSLFEELEKEKGNVKVIIKEKIAIKYDTILIKDTEYVQLNDSTHKLLWKYNGEQPSLYTTIYGENIFDIIGGKVLNPRTQITKLGFNLELITGITEIDNYYKIFIRTKEPNNNINFDLEGAIVDERFFTNNKDKWFIGPTFGVGISGPINSFNLYPTINWNIGISIGYKIWSF